MSNRNFVYRGTMLWYQLPMNLKSCENLNTFKTEIKKYWLLDEDVDVTGFDTVREFDLVNVLDRIRIECRMHVPVVLICMIF